LIEHLHANLHCKLTLISAPAGFGKTTLVSEWVREKDLPTAWLSLDEEDNDFTRFITYLIAALQSVHPNIDETPLSLLRAPQHPSVKGALTVLLNQLEEISFDFLVVLDDYHLIEDHNIHQAMDFLLSFQPTQMHLVILSRADPPLHLARLRGHDQLSEVRMSDLRFYEEECTQFLNKILDTNISEIDLNKLLTRTEGWVTGLQMAAISLRDREDISDFIDSFTGSHHYILDYLLEEVLQRETEEFRTFLFQTSILTRLNSALCNAVTRRENSHEILAYFDRSNLFIIPLNGERSWYRYHRLFSDLLQARLEESYQTQIPDLHRRASQWFEESGFMSLAIDHSLSAKDYQQALYLIEEIAERTLMHAQVSTLLRWREKLPANIIVGNPHLAFIFLWAQMLMGYQFDEVRTQVEKIADAQEILSGRKETLLAFIELSLANMEKAGEYAQQALEVIQADDIYFRSIALWVSGISRAIKQNLHESYQVLEELLQVSQVQHNTMFSVLTASQMARIHMRLGNLTESEKIFHEALEAGRDIQGKLLPIAGEVLMGLGELSYVLNQLDQASDYLLEGIELHKQWRDVAAMEAYITLSRVKQAQDDWDAAQDAMEKAMDLAIRYDEIDIDDRMVHMWQARLWIARGDLDLALGWAAGVNLKELTELDTCKEKEPAEYQLRLRETIVVTILHIKQKKYSMALDRIDWLLEEFTEQGRIETTVELLLLKAEVYYALDDNKNAMAALDQAITIAEPAGYIRLFLDRGHPIKILLERASQSTYVKAILSAFEEPTPKRQPSQQSLIDPLSERELEVIKLLPTNLTTLEMAEELYISVNTVRSHIKNIFRKLSVHKRSEAVNKARDLELI
jgi:LuxR family maltose regulon positive regulatory protein